MYTLETRYRPIPAKVLPKQTEPQVYYIDSQKEGPPTSEPTPPILREGMSSSLLISTKTNRFIL
jgi:hypothetical protein